MIRFKNSIHNKSVFSNLLETFHFLKKKVYIVLERFHLNSTVHLLVGCSVRAYNEMLSQ